MTELVNLTRFGCHNHSMDIVYYLIIDKLSSSVVLILLKDKFELAI